MSCKVVSVWLYEIVFLMNFLFLLLECIDLLLEIVLVWLILKKLFLNDVYFGILKFEFYVYDNFRLIWLIFGLCKIFIL